MKGLRSQESEKFNRFWDLVQDEAATQGCVFFGDCGEGRDLVTEELEFFWLADSEGTGKRV